MQAFRLVALHVRVTLGVPLNHHFASDLRMSLAQNSKDRNWIRFMIVWQKSLFPFRDWRATLVSSNHCWFGEAVKKGGAKGPTKLRAARPPRPPFADVRCS